MSRSLGRGKKTRRRASHGANSVRDKRGNDNGGVADVARGAGEAPNRGSAASAAGSRGPGRRRRKSQSQGNGVLLKLAGTWTSESNPSSARHS
mmetsp:Transcript_55023/g.154366  ORF Transcript_55023/g.154366 Transcript_55023/m.154366 type:complete len:93 (-) Transcript_55023:837-1115(-)